MKTPPVKKKTSPSIRTKQRTYARRKRKNLFTINIDDMIADTMTTLGIKMTVKERKLFVELYFRYVQMHILNGGKWIFPGEIGSVFIAKEVEQTASHQQYASDVYGNYYSAMFDSDYLRMTAFSFKPGSAMIDYLRKNITDAHVKYRAVKSIEL